MRETTKQIEIELGEEKRTFQIRKMNALAGSCLVKFCAEKLLPVYESLQTAFSSADEDASVEDVAKSRTDSILKIIPEALARLSEDELMDFEMRCLQTVDALYPAGWQPVMIGKTFGDEELEYDIGGVIRLVYEVLVYNLGSFFGGNLLASLQNRQSSSQSNQ